jgi:hypothetical protein
MKYEYKIMIDYGRLFVEEAYDLPSDYYKSQMCRRWEVDKFKKSIKEVKKEFDYLSNKKQIRSFKRTRDWALQNHPELLL